MTAGSSPERYLGAAEIAKRMLAKLLGETTHRRRPEIVERVHSLIEATDPEAIAALLEAMADRVDSHPFLKDIRVPTLVVAAMEDPLAPPEEVSSVGAGDSQGDLHGHSRGRLPGQAGSSGDVQRGSENVCRPRVSIATSKTSLG